MRELARSACAASAPRHAWKKRREPQHVHASVQLGQRARQRDPVLQRVAHAGRGLRAVAEHPPAAVGSAAEVGGIDLQHPPAARHDTDDRAQEVRAAGNDGGRKRAVAHQLRLAVDVGQDRVQQRGALDEAGADGGPLVLRNDQGEVAQRPRALLALAVVVHPVIDAAVLLVAIGDGEGGVDLAAPPGRQRGEHRLPVPPRPPGVVDHLVARPGERPVAVHERVQARLRDRVGLRRRVAHLRPVPCPAADAGRA
jgi:hypothetical protein